MATAVLAPEALPERTSPPRKLGLLRRFRKGGRKNKAAKSDVASEENRDDATMNQEVTNLLEIDSVESGGMKQVRFPAKQALKEKTEEVSSMEKPPAAREAAYGGPPRYDWIDIETAAAVKVQSVVRQNLTMARLEEEGITTAAIRNRNRRRQARTESRGASGSADVPNLFACCGIGLAFGDATEEDYEASRAFQREEYYQRKKERESHEEELRVAFQKQEAQKKAARKSDVQEVFEVIE